MGPVVTARGHVTGARQFLERGERLLVGSVVILGPAGRLQISMLWPDRRVVQPRRNRVRRGNLSVGILEQIAV